MHFIDIIEKHKKGINYTDEFYKIKNMYEEHIDNEDSFGWDDGIKNEIEKIFINYPERNRFLSLSELEHNIFLDVDINDELLYIPQNDNIFIITQEQLLIYIEYVYNMTSFLKRYIIEREKDLHMEKNKIVRLYHKILFLLNYIEILSNDMGTEIIQRNNIYSIVDIEEKKKIDIVLVGNKEFNNCDYLYEYIHIQNKNNLKRKREILKLLANDYEKYEAKIATIDKRLKSNIGYILNNYGIRHENLDISSNKYKIELKEISDEKFIEIYDKLFEMFLCAITLVDKEKYNIYVDNLKKDYIH